MSSQYAGFCVRPDELRSRWADAGFVMANSIGNAHSCSMKTIEDVRKYAAELGVSEEAALQRDIEEKSQEFVEKGADFYAKD